MIDLHTHTDASDGRLTSHELVQRAWMAGIRVLGITDHDTIAGLDERHGRPPPLSASPSIDGVEVTAVENGRDVHVLGYFVDPTDADLGAFLARQREQRTARVKEIGARLERIGAPIDVPRLLASREAREAIGRPAVAAALIAAGHATSQADAFDRFLGEGGAAWVPREGPSVSQVIDVLHRGGRDSLARAPGAEPLRCPHRRVGGRRPRRRSRCFTASTRPTM